MNFKNDLIIDNVSMVPSFVSDPIQCNRDLHIAIQAVVSAESSIVGVINIEASLDEADFQKTPTNWVLVPTLTANITGNGVTHFSVSNFAFNWIRLSYVKTSGSATMNARVNKKGF